MDVSWWWEVEDCARGKVAVVFHLMLLSMSILLVASWICLALVCSPHIRTETPVQRGRWYVLPEY